MISDRIRFAVIALCLMFGCSHADERQAAPQSGTGQQQILIVYLSRTQNTKAVAQMIQAHVGGTLIELAVATPYPTDYRKMVDQVARENETGFLPPLKTRVRELAKYEIVFVGFPTWGMQLPPPMKSFLSQHDLSNKTVIPFNTNAGYGIGSSFATVKELCKGSRVLEGFSTKGGIERDGVLLAVQGQRASEVQAEVAAWLKKIGLLK